MENNKIPLHVGIIMDGNGRWAERRHKKRNYGHSKGMEAMMAVARRAAERGVKYLTVYALSTENVKNRPAEELEGLYGLLRKYFTVNVKKLQKEGAAVKIIGDVTALPADVQSLLREGEETSPQNAPFTVIFALNYGSRAEIVRAAQTLSAQNLPFTEQNFASALYTCGVPDPDLIIRTGGEVRLSNFLMWQSAYAELYFTDILFPDFTAEEFDKALSDYSERRRRFGGVGKKA